MKKLLILLAMLALITATSQRRGGGNPTQTETVEPVTLTSEAVETAVRSNGDPFTVSVPGEELGSAKEYGFALWIKASYLAPVKFDFRVLQQNSLGIAGVYEYGAGYCGTRVGKRALSIELLQAGYSQNPSFLFNTYSIATRTNGDEQIEFPTREDFDHEWNFIYYSYSYEQNRAFAYVYFSRSDVALTHDWDNQVKRQPVPDLNFRLGGCNHLQSRTFQGQYNNVAFFYGPTGSGLFEDDLTALELYKNANVHAALTPQPTIVTVQPIIGNDAVTVESNSNEARDYVLENLNGAEEYAVWGWAKWEEPSNRASQHTLFRLTSDQPGEYSDDSQVGDRTLSVLIGQETLEFSTYAFDWSGTQPEPNFIQSIDATTASISEWFFVYFGYSQAQQQGFAYVHFQLGDYTLTWNGIYHMRPDQLVLQLGKDEFNRGFNGKLQNWNFANGPGAYVTSGFETYYSVAVFESDQVVVETQATVEVVGYPETYETGFQDTDSAYHYQVPQEELALVQDVTMSFWFRWNYQYPSYADVSTLKANMMSVAHITETDATGTNLGDRLLSVWLKPFMYGRKTLWLSTYASTSNRPNYGKDVGVRRGEDFDGAWTWLYYSHSRATNTLFAYVRFQSGTVVTKNWRNCDHNYPPQSLHLRVGKSSYSDYTFNGEFFNVQFQYQGANYLGTREQVEALYNDNLIKPHLGPVEYHDEVIQTTAQEFFGGPAEHGVVLSTYDGAQASEYSAYGWSKWTPTQAKQAKHVMFRLTTDEEDQLADKEKPGDRTLVFYVGEGVLVAATYTQSFTDPDPLLNSVKNQIPYEDDLESWYWVYFGYNHETQRAFTFVRFYDRVYSFTFDGISHLVPRRFRFTLGDDSFLNSYNGLLQDWHLTWGVGAYRENNFEQLYSTEFMPVDQPELDLDNTWTEEPYEENSFAVEEAPVREVELTSDQLSAGVRSYSFSFWSRFGFLDPKKVSVNDVTDNSQAMAGITEQDGYHLTTLGAKALSLYLKPLGGSAQPTFQFSTYSTNRNQNDDSKDLVFAEEDLETTWNWVYFGYDLDLQKAYAVVAFSRTRQTMSLTWDQTVHNVPSRLKFQLGKPQGDTAEGFNGIFYDVRFRTDRLAYKEGVNVDNYLSSSVRSPPFYNPQLSKLSLTDNIVEYDENSQASDNFYQYPSQYRGASQYAVYGWAKWTETSARQQVHSIFRLTTNTPSNAGDMDSQGDRTLACFVSREQLSFNTYTYGESTTGADDDHNLTWEVDFQDDLTQWFFVYFGYSKQDQKAKVFVKFQDREESHEFTNVKHAGSKYFGVYLGKDMFYPAFNGQYNQWVFQIGEGAYQEADYDSLYTLVVDESDNREYSQSTVQDVVVNQDEDVVIQTTLYEEQVPQDQLSGTNHATVWTWFSWGFNIPRYFGNPATSYGNCYHITRLVYGSGQGVYADFCFSEEDGSANVRFTETSSGSDVVQTVPLPSFDDLDNSWNFVYMTHDQDLQMTTVYVYFAGSQQRWIYSFDSANWNFPSEYIRFKLGGGATNGRRLFNGRFFDAQMSTYFRYSQHDVAAIAVVQTQVTAIPSLFRTDSLELTSQTISFTSQNDGEVETDDTVNTAVTRQLNGFGHISTYSVRGWARWTGVAGQNANRLVHRLTQHNPEELTDDSQPGDRALSLFLQTDGTLAFSTYNYEGRNGNNNLVVSTDTDVTSLISNWFFVYQGYSYEQRRSFVFVRFSDDTEFSQSIENVRQLQSNTYGLYLGRDSLSAAWRGSFNSYSFTAGGNSFVSNAVDARSLQESTTTVTLRWRNRVAITVDGESGSSSTGSTSAIQNNVRQWRSISSHGTVNGHTFGNTYEGYSYFFDEDGQNTEYKVVLTGGVPEGSSICFGFIPSTLIHLITENPDVRYTDDAIAVCSSDEQLNCFGTGECTNGQFVTEAGTTYLWKFQDDQVVLKKQPTIEELACVLVDHQATNGDIYTAEDGQCFYDVINFLDYEPGPTPAPQYQCSFGRERRCLEEGQRDFLVPYVELRGTIEVEFLVDDFGENDIIDTTEQTPCQDTTEVVQNVVECGVPPPPPPPTPPIVITPLVTPPVTPPLTPPVTPPVVIITPPPPPPTCDEAPTYNVENLRQLWSSEQGFASNILVNPDEVQMTYTTEDPENGNANYEATFPPTTGSFCVGYHSESNENDLIAICSNGTSYNYDGSFVCNGQMRFDRPNTLVVTVQSNYVQITSSDLHYQCDLDRPSFNNDVLLPYIHFNFNDEVNVRLTSTGGSDCPMDFEFDQNLNQYGRRCRERNQVQAWDYEIQDNSYTEERFGVVDTTLLANDDPDHIKVFFSPATNALASYTVTLITYEEELSKYVCFGYMNPALEDTIRDAPGESRWTDSISACTDTTTNNAFDGSQTCTGHFDDYAGATFAMDITDVEVTIRQIKDQVDETTFSCTFNRDPTIDYIPWIEIDGLYSLEAPFTGCSEYVPVNRNCSNDYDNLSQLDGTAWTNAIDFTTTTDGSLTTNGQYASILNRNSNFNITLPQDSGKVCFGFVTLNQWNNDISVNYDIFYEPESNKICNDEDFNANGNCQGEYNGQMTFTATVQQQSTQFTSSDQQVQCNFQRQGDASDLLPWVLVEQVSRGNPVLVELTGLGGMNCPLNINVLPRTPTPTPPVVIPDVIPPVVIPDVTPPVVVTPVVVAPPPPPPGRCDAEQLWTAKGSLASQDGHVLENSDIESGQFYSKANAGAQFTVTVSGNGVNTCIGYANPQVVEQLDDLLSLNPVQFSSGMGLCTDGSVYNYDGGQPVAHGVLDPSYASLFFVYFDSENNNVAVSTLNREYHVDFPLQEGQSFDELVPWVVLEGATRVVANATCENPYFAPTPEPVYEACSQIWKSSNTPSYTDVSDNDGVSNLQNDYGFINYWSPINVNMQFAVTFRENDGENVGNTCIGFVPALQVAVLQSGESVDNRDSAVGFCTDSTHFNVFEQQNVCRGDLSASVDEEIYVWRVDDYVNVRSSDDQFECVFRVEGDLVPWVQQSGRQSVLAKVTCEDPPACETTCNAWNDTSRVQQNWEKFQQAAFTLDSFLRNEGQDSVSYISGINTNANYKVTLNQDSPAQEVCFGYVARGAVSYIVNNPTRENSQFSLGVCSNNQTFNTQGGVVCEGLNEFSFNGEFGNTYRSIVRANTVQIFSVTGDKGNFACTFDRNENETLVPWVQLGPGHSVVAAFDGLGGHDCEEAPHFCGYVAPPPPPVPRPECAYLYSDCNYQGVSFQICGDGDNETLPQECNGAVLSIWLPPGAQVNLQCLESGEVDCGGRSVNFGASETCMNSDSRLSNVGSAQFVQKQSKMTTVTNFKNLKNQIQNDESTALALIQMKNSDGSCVTLYSECGFQGKSQQICNQQPHKVLKAKSLTIPDGWKVEMFQDKSFRNFKAMYSYDVDCLNGDTNYHLKFDNKKTQQSIFVQVSEAKHLKKNRI